MKPALDTPSEASQYSFEDKKSFLEGDFPEDKYTLSPRSLPDRVCDAIDGKTQSFEPLSYSPPEAWKLTQMDMGGNQDLDGHFERTAWDHPLYGTVVVESPKGMSTFTATFAGTDIHVGSRYMTYLRTAAAITERDSPPKIPTQRWRDKLKQWDSRPISKRQEAVERWLSTFTDEYAQEQLLDTVSEIARCLTLFRSHELQLRSHVKEISTPLNTIYQNHDYSSK
jgi:hypothetical protein